MTDNSWTLEDKGKKDKEPGRDVPENDDNENSKNIQQRVEALFNNLFANWGVYLSNNPCSVFWLSILFFCMLSLGMENS